MTVKASGRCTIVAPLSISSALYETDSARAIRGDLQLDISGGADSIMNAQLADLPYPPSVLADIHNGILPIAPPPNTPDVKLCILDILTVFVLLLSSLSDINNKSLAVGLVFTG